MDTYPSDYVAHNLPLIFISGLQLPSDLETDSLRYPLLHENGYPLKLDLPPVTTPTAQNLLKILLDADARDGAWNSRNEAGRPGGVGFKMQTIGRSFVLPPRKAKPPPTSPSLLPILSSRGSPPPSPVLHSPISPLTPSSPTFPDAVMTPLWVSKHDRLLPSAIIVFCPLTTDRNLSSLRDNQLKTEINAFRSSLEATKYKTRLVIILMSDGLESDGDSEERIAGIRRATNMDSKNSFFSLPEEPLQVELREFVKSLFLTLQPSCVEYYRDLSKHARKKRNRGSTPPPTAPPTSGTSQVLSVQGWNVRYEFKLGVFAEFRQEMDAACRNYESAYEGLLGQDVFETIAGWSPRFNDTRLLADAIAVRIIRCLLWNGQTSTAVRSWSNHRSRMQDLVDRRGKGTNNYGWEAWEARWSQVMAEIMIRVDLPSLTALDNTDIQSRRTGFIYALPEKAFPIGERLPPWDMLHHPGYWFYRAAKHTIIRLQMAQQIPEEDRAAPGQSPASQLANKSYIYDTYLAPEPHVESPLPGKPRFDHLDLITDALRKSINEFAERNQMRKSIHLRLELARTLKKNGVFHEAHGQLAPLWRTLPWRSAGWWELLQEFDWLLRECAIETADHAESVIMVDWELMNKVFPARPDWEYNLSNCLKGMTIPSPKPAVVLKSDEVVSCVSASFGFRKFEGNVGEPLRSQLIVTSNAQPVSVSIVLSEVKIVFEGALRPIWLMHQGASSLPDDQLTKSRIEDVGLRDTAHSTDLSSPTSPAGGIVSLVGRCDLSLHPGQSRVYNLTSIPRESGDVRLDSITLLLEEKSFSLAYVVPGHDHEGGVWISQTQDGPKLRQFGYERNVTAVKIQPKPPKIRIETPSLIETYYTDEEVRLDIDIINEEDEAADVEIEVRLLGGAEDPAKLSWIDLIDDDENENALTKEVSRDGDSSLGKRPIGELQKRAAKKLQILISGTSSPFDYEMEIVATYHLLSDRETPIIKAATVDVTFIRPFEGHYDYLPRLHPDRWPNFFHVNEDIDPKSGKPVASGIPQRYCLNAKLIPLAQESLVVEDVYPVVVGTTGDITCLILLRDHPFHAEAVPPESFGEFNFDFDVRKLHLEDRRPAAVTLSLAIRWHRPSSPDRSNVTNILISRFVIPYEPRVLATVLQDTPGIDHMIRRSSMPGLLHMDYTIENPSMHTLPFALNMEASEEFAFSGAKARTLHLLPYTRQTVRYNLLPAKRGVWIKPKLEVTDTYFNTKVKVFPGTEGMKRDKKDKESGVMVFVEEEKEGGVGAGAESEGCGWLSNGRL